MKQYFKNYLFILITLLLLTFFASLILTIMEKNQFFSYKTSLIVANSVSYSIIAILSFILGYKNKKHGLFHGTLFSIILILLTIIMGNKISDFATIIKIITKTIIIMFFVVLGVNKKNS